MINFFVKEKKFLFFLFIFSFLLRFLFFEFFLFKKNGHWVCVDSNEYHSVATQIAKGNGILNEKGQTTLYRVPGYSLFLAGCYKVFDFNVKKTLWIQILLSSFIPLLVFLLTCVLIPSAIVIARFAAILMSLSLGAILHSGILMSDSLFLLFFLLFLILFFSYFNRTRSRISGRDLKYKYLFVSGLFLGIASLIRPVGHFLLIISILILFFSSFTIMQRIKSSLFLFLGWFIPILPWLLRNFVLTGAVIFHTMPGYHFLNYFAAEVESKNIGYSYSCAKNKLLEEWNNLVLNEEKKLDCKINEIKCFALAQKVALKYLKKNPIQTIKHAFTNIVKTMLSLNSSYIWFIASKKFPFYDNTTTLWNKIKRYLFPKTDNTFVIFLIYYEIIMLTFLLFGFFGGLFLSFLNKNLFCMVVKILPFILLLFFLTLGSGVARLRLAIEPFMFIIAGIFWQRFYNAIISEK